jgi:homeobox protein cut-like
MRLAVDAYHRELAKLNPNSAGALPLPLSAMHQHAIANHNGIAQDLSMPKPERKERVNDEEKKEDERHGGSAFSLVRPKVEPSKLKFIFIWFAILVVH